MAKPSQQVLDDLYFLGIDPDEASAETIEDIATLEELYWWNQWYQNNGFPQAVNEDYGDLNMLAIPLGIHVDQAHVEVSPNNAAAPMPPIVTGRSRLPLDYGDTRINRGILTVSLPLVKRQ